MLLCFLQNFKMLQNWGHDQHIGHTVHCIAPCSLEDAGYSGTEHLTAHRHEPVFSYSQEHRALDTLLKRTLIAWIRCDRFSGSLSKISPWSSQLNQVSKRPSWYSFWGEHVSAHAPQNIRRMKKTTQKGIPLKLTGERIEATHCLLPSKEASRAGSLALQVDYWHLNH